ncbi:hypothetical protein AAL_00866 [Moelleriella libera RCEF 2490]|uniref:Uncharacterized protein n=1 Tax=Moelleriella libera RCEF 2490 TaxID=1081109 RepID=A0A166V8X6_9HYPO|nr:hypothetical protein AAL_00866 [Moelleriella libera RCEF 2490]
MPFRVAVTASPEVFNLLHSPRMTDRIEWIASARRKSFRGVMSDTTNIPKATPWRNSKRWLNQATWTSSLPGKVWACKSTPMKYIEHTDRVTALLKAWTTPASLVVATSCNFKEVEADDANAA